MAYYATYMPDETGEMQKVVINAGVGFCLPYYGEAAPPGTLACDGSEISRTVYDELFQVLGTKAGAGDGVSTFNLPDMRGVFVRGTGGNAAALGVQQGDAIREIAGVLGGYNSWLFNDICSGCFEHDGISGTTKRVNTYEENPTYANSPRARFAASYVVPTAAENRPVNVALLWCIIYE